MAYCDADYVSRMTKDPYGATTQPTKERVTEITEGVSAELDGYLAAAGYTVPVTAPQSALDFLEILCGKCSAVQAWHESRDTDAAYPKITDWQADCAAAKMALRKGELILPGIVPTGDFEPAFGIVPTIPRDRYFTTEQTLDQE